jgi:hypothetical protein
MFGDVTRWMKPSIARPTQPAQDRLFSPVTAPHDLTNSLDTGEEVDSATTSTGAVQRPTVATVPKRGPGRPRKEKQTTTVVRTEASVVASVHEANQPTTRPTESPEDVRSTVSRKSRSIVRR